MKKQAACLLAIIMSGCGVPERDLPVPIHPGVYEPYDEEGFPRLYARWGAHRVQGKLQQLREDAAEKVALSRDCDAVEISEISERNSTALEPEVFVDCRNGARWRLAQADLNRPLGGPDMRY